MVELAKCVLVCAALICALATATAAAAAAADGDGERKAQAIEIEPRNENDVNFIHKLTENPALDFLSAPGAIGEKVVVLVDEADWKSLREKLRKNNVKHSIVSAQLERGAEADVNEAKAFEISNRMGDDDFELGRHHSYAEIVEWANELARLHPKIVRAYDIGVTHEGRAIRVIAIGNPPIANGTRRAVWIDGGMHAREWTAIHTALYFIDKLTSAYGVDEAVTTYLNALTFHILPVANPDGYEFSRSSSRSDVRYWRKNRNPNDCAPRDKNCCRGVDLNRNFDVAWNDPKLRNKCHATHNGASAFSEPESRAIRDTLMGAELAGRVDAFISLHAFSQLWTYPYNYANNTFPEDVQELHALGLKATDALRAVHKTDYYTGSAVPILNTAGGGSDDWAKKVAQIKYVYLIELPPREWNLKSFALNASRLIPVGEETWAGVSAVVDAVMKRAAAENAKKSTPHTPLTDNKQFCERLEEYLRSSPRDADALVDYRCECQGRDCEKLTEAQRVKLEFNKKKSSPVCMSLLALWMKWRNTNTSAAYHCHCEEKGCERLTAVQREIIERTKRLFSPVCMILTNALSIYPHNVDALAAHRCECKLKDCEKLTAAQRTKLEATKQFAKNQQQSQKPQQQPKPQPTDFLFPKD